MGVEINSDNPAVKAIITGTAPQTARLAASRGILPLPQNDLLEVLVALAQGEDKELSSNANNTLASQDAANLEDLFKSGDVAPSVLGYFIQQNNTPTEVQRAVLSNQKTPNDAIIRFARNTPNGELLEIISLNQQLLIKNPAIIDAVIANPYKTAEAERRVSEVKREFFEKERGAQQIANELRAQGKDAAAEFVENSEFAADLDELAPGSKDFEDLILLAEHIETPDSEINDSWMSLEYIEEIYEETDEERQAIVDKILGELSFEDEGEISGERVSMLNRILRMKMKDRVKLAMKGDREARTILIRDPNRIVSQAVINNPRITENEVEKIATMRVVPEDILRQIAINRAWARNYTIMHNLARNPRTPISNIMSILTRLQLRDLNALTKNRNVSDVVRRQALRLVNARTGKR